MNNNQLWQAVLGELELTLSKANFTTWFKGTHIVDKIDSKIIIGVPNTFTKAWLEKKFRRNIFDILDKITSNAIRDIEFKVAQKQKNTENNPQNTEKSESFSVTRQNTQPEIPNTEVPAPKIEPTQLPTTEENPTKPQFSFTPRSQQDQSSSEKTENNNNFSSNTSNKYFKAQPLEKKDYASVSVNTSHEQNGSSMNNLQTSQHQVQSTIKAFTLNKKYNFDNFIVGKCNELSHAAAKAVADKPGHSYNPLFIYGGVGLGKTHLLQAIGNKVKELNPNAKILYVSSEKFTSDYVKALTTRKIDQFKHMYRTVDLLLMDDIQFLAGKESTQEEFFHTFNELHQNNRQLVVTSDRPPKAIPELESRLLSRFEWGMIADVAPIDYETRFAIVERKCLEKGIHLAKDIIDYIARSIHSNVRELEGALNRIKAHIELQNITPDLTTIKNVLATLSNLPRTDSLTPDHVIKVVTKFFDITTEELLGKGRSKKIVYPRQIVMYLLREELQSSYPTIGKEIGGRDHTTAMHACQKMSKALETDEKIRQDYNLIKQKLFT